MHHSCIISKILNSFHPSFSMQNCLGAWLLNSCTLVTVDSPAKKKIVCRKFLLLFSCLKQPVVQTGTLKMKRNLVNLKAKSCQKHSTRKRSPLISFSKTITAPEPLYTSVYQVLINLCNQLTESLLMYITNSLHICPPSVFWIHQLFSLLWWCHSPPLWAPFLGRTWRLWF